MAAPVTPSQQASAKFFLIAGLLFVVGAPMRIFVAFGAVGLVGIAALSLTAVDSIIGHSLTYAWTASCSGSLAGGLFSPSAAAPGRDVAPAR